MKFIKRGVKKQIPELKKVDDIVKLEVSKDVKVNEIRENYLKKLSHKFVIFFDNKDISKELVIKRYLEQKI